MRSYRKKGKVEVNQSIKIRRFTKDYQEGMTDKEYIKQRFWSKVNKRGDSECWEWQRGRHPNGYGACKIAGISTNKAHRIAWILTRGQIPEGLYVCHRCDNPPCCNPNHLFLGTQKDNIMDNVLKGRQHKKLSEKDIIEIRRKCTIEGVSQAKIAKQFDLCRQAVSQIVAGERWAWVEYLPSNGKKRTHMKLSNDDVTAIRKRYADSSITKKELGKAYNVDPSTISRIISMQSRKEVTT